MTARTAYNMNSSAVKRIMQEARELANDPCTDYSAAPLENDIFEWHCTIRGSPGTEFEGGLYHFRILLPSEYPFRPPSIMMLTPNGRFELNTKICISFTNYHEELWQPAWGVRTAIIGLQGFFPLKGTAAVGVGALEYPVAERKRLAALSRGWICPTCNMTMMECLPDPPEDSSSASSSSQPPTDVPEASQQDAVSKVVHNLDATNAADPPTPIMPAPSAMSPPILAPKPRRPIDTAAIIIPPSPAGLTPSGSPVPRAVPNIEQAKDAGLLPPPQDDSRAQTPIELSPIPGRRSVPRPPILLDTAICVLLVSVFALLCRRVL